MIISLFLFFAVATSFKKASNDFISQAYDLKFCFHKIYSSGSHYAFKCLKSTQHFQLSH